MCCWQWAPWSWSESRTLLRLCGWQFITFRRLTAKAQRGAVDWWPHGHSGTLLPSIHKRQTVGPHLTDVQHGAQSREACGQASRADNVGTDPLHLAAIQFNQPVAAPQNKILQDSLSSVIVIASLGLLKSWVPTQHVDMLSCERLHESRCRVCLSDVESWNIMVTRDSDYWICDQSTTHL